MTQAAHTPGPWQDAATDDSLIVVGRTKIASTYEVPGDVWGMANRNRILACVNACEGIADPPVVGEAIEALRVLSAEAEEADCLGYNWKPARAKALAALAKLDAKP